MFSGAAGTQSGPLLDVSKLDVRKAVERPAVAKALMMYLIHVEVNPRKALELGAAATAAAGFGDWWWKSAIAAACSALALHRDAEQQLASALRQRECVALVAQMVRVQLQLGNRTSAVDLLAQERASFPHEPQLALGLARLHSARSLTEAAVSSAAATYQAVLQRDPTNVEALACVAADCFYDAAPELALTLYLRLLQAGPPDLGKSPQLWNNLGLACFSSGGYDLALTCFQRAIAAAAVQPLASASTLQGNDTHGEQDREWVRAEVWHNIATLAASLGDLVLARQAFTIALTSEPRHAESLTGVAVLHLRDGRVESAVTACSAAAQASEWLFEPHYNAGLIAYRQGKLADAHTAAKRSAELFPVHSGTRHLRELLEAAFSSVCLHGSR